MHKSAVLTLLVGLTTLFVAGPAQALQMGTRCWASGLLGIADADDLTTRFGNLPNPSPPGNSPLINDDQTDDALVCVHGHVLTGDVNTQGEWVIELANTASHEMGHLVSLLHLDDIGNDDLMFGPYDGMDKGFGARSLNLLNNNLANTSQVVWLDFEAESAELPIQYQGFGLSKATQFGALNMLQLNIIKANVLAQVQADYNNGNPFNANFTVSFTMNMPTSGSYSTVSFITPEPSSAVLLGLGLLAGAAVARRVRR